VGHGWRWLVVKLVTCCSNKYTTVGGWEFILIHAGLAEVSVYNPFMKIIYRMHAIERMFERGIGVADIQAALDSGETIEHYADTHYPGRLILIRRGRRSLHVVAAENAADAETIIVTCYQPHRARWTEDFKQRRDEMPDV
jgi:hypothetical protein